MHVESAPNGVWRSRASTGPTDAACVGACHVQGTVCGTGSKADAKFVYYPQITTDLLNFAKSGETNPLNIDLYGVCLSACPSLGDVVCNAGGRTAIDSIKAPGNLTDIEVMSLTSSASSYLTYGTTLNTVRQNCWVVPLETTDYFYRCLWQRNSTTTRVVTCQEPESLAGVVIDANTPANITEACVTKLVTDTTATLGAGQDSDPLMEQLFDATAQMGRYVSDTQKAMAPILVCGGVLALLFGFLWLLFVQRCAGCLVWTTILSVIFVLIAGTVYSYDQAGLLDVALSAATDTFNDAAGTSFSVEAPTETDSTSDLQTRWKYFAYLATIVTVIVILLVLFMIKRIRIAIAVIKEAAKSVRTMPAVMLFPVRLRRCSSLRRLFCCFASCSYVWCFPPFLLMSGCVGHPDIHPRRVLGDHRQLRVLERRHCHVKHCDDCHRSRE